MLKHIFLNNKKLPVPVPIKTLAEAINWAEDALLTADRIITKVVLDGQIRYDAVEDISKALGVELTQESTLHLQVDSAKDLSLQSLDALRNLMSVLERNLKPTAVSLWQCSLPEGPQNLRQVMEDINLSQALLDHLLAILEVQPDGRLNTLAAKLDKIRLQLAAHAGTGDWKALAQVMLNQYEPEILLLSSELSVHQRHLFDLRVAEQVHKA